MSNDLSTQEGGAIAPFGQMHQMAAGTNVGAVKIESERAIAEARGQMQLAKMFPRSTIASIAEFMEACKSPDFAAGAFYSVPNRGSGPSIRFAEEAARCYGNFEYGHRELSRMEGTGGQPGKSEIEVFAWDKEKNNRSTRQITVMHVVDTKNGPKRLTDQADIDNKIANVASKQIRGRILALMPKHMILAGQAECKKTIAGSNDKPLSERVQRMVSAFSKYGVTVAHIERYVGHKIDETTADDLAELMGIFNAIKEGAKVAEYFPSSEQDDTAGTGAAIADAAKAAAKGAGKKGAAPAPAPAPDDQGPGDPPPPQESNPKEGNSKTAKETKRESAQKSAPAPAPAPATDDGGDEQPGSEEAGQEDDVF